MGLDMYLEKKSKLSEEVEEVGYWRKANHIHKWFVDNLQGGVDNCETSEVTKEQLLKLKLICEIVLSDKKIANVLLPTQSGFFFGSTEYDEFYFEDLENTINILDLVIITTDFENETITYSASW